MAFRFCTRVSSTDDDDFDVDGSPHKFFGMATIIYIYFFFIVKTPSSGPQAGCGAVHGSSTSLRVYRTRLYGYYTRRWRRRRWSLREPRKVKFRPHSIVAFRNAPVRRVSGVRGARLMLPYFLARIFTRCITAWFPFSPNSTKSPQLGIGNGRKK